MPLPRPFLTLGLTLIYALQAVGGIAYHLSTCHLSTCDLSTCDLSTGHPSISCSCAHATCQERSDGTSPAKEACCSQPSKPNSDALGGGQEFPQDGKFCWLCYVLSQSQTKAISLGFLASLPFRDSIIALGPQRIAVGRRMTAWTRGPPSLLWLEVSSSLL